MQVEERAYDVALDRLNWRRQVATARGDKLGAMNLSPLKKTMWDWHEKLVPLIEEEIQRCEDLVQSKSSGRREYAFT